MPRIELITEVLYNPNDPIHWEVDNLPLKAILERQNLINSALDNVIGQMRDAIGTQGSVANRLNQSINADGSLKSAAIDEALHSIEDHEDTDNYVRMTKDQSDKLDTLATSATNTSLRVYTNVGLTESTAFSSGEVKIQPSDTLVPEVVAPNIVKFNLTFPLSAAHRHYYGLVPVHDDTIDPDYVNYKVTSVSTPFVEDSLRVYVNGVRVFEDVEVYVPGVMVDDPWTLLKFTPDHTGGTFEFSSALSEDDIVRIDFDVALA